LQQKTEHSFDLQEMKDWYLPYKKKRKTKAEGFIRRNAEILLLTNRIV
jgi:transcriptional accessory protein Tex/SPT6